MSSGVFRGKESSNRIELSQSVQDLLNFGVLGSLRLWAWGWVDRVVGVVGGCPHTCAHACTYMHAHKHVKHDNFNCKWQPPLGESLGIPYDVMHACTCICVCACAHVWGAPSQHPLPHPPTPTPWGTPGISQNSIALELIEIFQFCLKI